MVEIVIRSMRKLKSTVLDIEKPQMLNIKLVAGAASGRYDSGLRVADPACSPRLPFKRFSHAMQIHPGVISCRLQTNSSAIACSDTI
jgi:hypothetical protein